MPIPWIIPSEGGGGGEGGGGEGEEEEKGAAIIVIPEGREKDEGEEKGRDGVGDGDASRHLM